MKLMKAFNNAFGFTPTESKVVLFLLAMFVLGLAVKTFMPDRGAARFDYRESDSVFARRSAEPVVRAGAVAGPESARGPFGGRQKKVPPAVDINSATKEEFTALPGIGGALAERIVLYREENGPFRSLEELMNVKGIGRKKYDQLVPYCRLGK
ncbi:MAG TPA: helix-hairpin-helix domain-containing protein [Bacteroidota bacterium]|nr:helix-hairpin-helix domain-containing protein [Bacteroidota bacterium]